MKIFKLVLLKARKEIREPFFVCILGKLKTPQFLLEIFWPYPSYKNPLMKWQIKKKNLSENYSPVSKEKELVMSRWKTSKLELWSWTKNLKSLLKEYPRNRNSSSLCPNLSKSCNWMIKKNTSNCTTGLKKLIFWKKLATYKLLGVVGRLLVELSVKKIHLWWIKIRNRLVSLTRFSTKIECTVFNCSFYHWFFWLTWTEVRS